MASNYPGGLDAFTTGTLTGVVAGADHGNKADALNKIEAAVGAGVTNGRLKVVQEAPINIQWPEYAALASGDDWTLPLQAVADLVNAVPASSSSKGRAIYLPYRANGYKTTAPMNFRSVFGLKMFGDGQTISRIVAMNGSTLDSLLDLDGVAYSLFEDFSLEGEGTATVDKALHMYWGTGTGRSTTRNSFRNLFISNMKYRIACAVAQTNPSNQNDECVYDNVTAAGSWTAGETSWWQWGFRIGTGTQANVLQHEFLKCNGAGNRYNMDFTGSGGNWHGGEVLQSEIHFLGRPNVDEVSIQGVRTESGTRLFQSDPSGGLVGFPGMVSISDVWYDGSTMNADKKFIRFLQGGILRLSSIQCKGTADPIIEGDNGGLGGGIIDVNGLIATTAPDSLFTGGVDPTVGVHRRLRNYIRVDASEVTVSLHPGEYYLPEAAGDIGNNVVFRDAADNILKYRDTGGTLRSLY